MEYLEFLYVDSRLGFRIAGAPPVFSGSRPDVATVQALGWLEHVEEFPERFILLLGALALARLGEPRLGTVLCAPSPDGVILLPDIRRLHSFRSNRDEAILRQNIFNYFDSGSRGGRQSDLGCLERFRGSRGRPTEDGLRLRLSREQIRFSDVAATAFLNRLREETAKDALVAVPAPALPPPLLLPDLPYDPATYGHRFRVESQARERLRHAGIPVIIQAPEGYGKTTFVSWLLDEGVAALPAHRAVRIRLSTFSESVLSSLAGVLGEIAERLLRGLGHDDVETLLAAARARPGGELERLRWLLGQYVLSSDQLLILVLERADRLLGSPVQEDFFALLRVMMEEDDGPFAKLRLVVTVATEPMLLDTIDHSGFFSRTQPLELLDLDDEEIRHLAQRHGQTLLQSDIELLRSWLGGQPALLRLAFYQAAQEHLSLQSLLEEKSLRIATFRSHLLRLHRWIERHPQLRATLFAVLHDPEQRLSPEDYGLLYSKALLREHDGGLRLSCRLYADYLLPLLQPHGEAGHAAHS